MSSICTPDLNRGLLDKMILLAENANMSPVICINKCDLDEVSAKRVCEEYEKRDIPVFIHLHILKMALTI